MTEFSKLKEEIIDEIKKRHSKSYIKIIDKINCELDELEITEGINNENNLVSFYNIWKDNIGNVGSENEVNSWAAYALGMTAKKPEGEFLSSRRVFARAGFPDIDTDFDDEGRQEIYKYIIEKYGRENVGNIGTHNLLKFKSCITRLVKTLDIADSFEKGESAYITDNVSKVDEILAPFPKKGLLRIKDEKDGEFHIIKSIQDAYDHCSDFKYYMDKYPEIKKHAENIENLFGNFSVHAAGIVVSDIPLQEIAPLRTASKGLLATQFTNEDLEEMGLIKFDILALKSLSIIKRTLKLIQENHDIKIDIENLPIDDKNTLNLYREGNLGGVFQCEEWGMQNTMKDIGVDKFDDIMAAIALYRPGPMDFIPEYCNRKKGIIKVNYFHSSIELFVKPYLKNTYGIIIFQEQIMQICNSLAGFSISDGYVMIKAIGKKIKDLMKKFEKQFINGCINNKVSEEIAKRYWDEVITPFSSYGFCVAHACAYSVLSFQTCYLKANYPAEFISSLLSVESKRANYDKLSKFEREFQRKMNIKILPGDLNKSKVNYTIENKKNKDEKIELRSSLLCKGLGIKPAKHFEENQPYDGVEEKNMEIILKSIINKTDSSVIDLRVINSFIEEGFFGKNNIKNKEKIIDKFVKIREDLKKAAKKGVESMDIFS